MLPQAFVRGHLLKKLPGGIQTQDEDVTNHVVQAVESVLKHIRYDKENRKPTKRKRLNVEPGKPVATSEESVEEEDDDDDTPAGAAGIDEDDEEYDRGSTEPRLALVGAPASKNLPSVEAKKKKMAARARVAEGSSVSTAKSLIEEVSALSCQPNDFLVVVYENQGEAHWWLGRVEEVLNNEGNEEAEENEVRVSFLHPYGPKTSFQWPSQTDTCLVPESNILGRLKHHPAPSGSRKFCISSDDMDAAEDLFLSRIMV
ncbi:MAG: hypothetical protein GY696_00005 [Gammaproteobacteria bacterium]|nr:hypothetical protein [Gammaproteobacteria bacterium]